MQTETNSTIFLVNWCQPVTSVTSDSHFLEGSLSALRGALWKANTGLA